MSRSNIPTAPGRIDSGGIGPDGIDSDSAAFAEQLLAQFLAEPSQVPPSWQRYFTELFQNGERPKISPPPRALPRSDVSPRVMVRGEGSQTGVPAGRLAAEGTARQLHLDGALLQDRVDHLIRAYRARGHLVARLDPLGLPRSPGPDLTLEAHGLTAADLDRPVSAAWVGGGPGTQTVRDVVARMWSTYCRYIGVQFMHIDDPVTRDWLQQRMEASENRISLSRAEQLRILTRLTDAVIFEQFVRKKYVGAKTFSLEGSESLIPLLDLAIAKAARLGVAEIVMGMAHRGRLNVLANIIRKSPQEIFSEFDDAHPERADAAGDLTYHLGFSSDWKTDEGQKIHLSLCFNPSHLEFINPVAVGRVRAKQDRAGDTDRRKGLTLLIHGDAAFAGEGVVQETLNLSRLEGYSTGGTLHIIVNNQIGFTTSPEEGRSTVYASDVAKMLQSPIFHVNGEHPESVAQAVDLAMDFREKFRRDVVIDMYCYRRWGHNEADEPGFTQPLLYQAIEHQRSVRDGYLEHLLKLEGVTREEADRIAAQRFEKLETAFEEARRGDFTPAPQTLTGAWQCFQGGAEPPDDEPPTGVPAGRLVELLTRLTQIPEGFHLHKTLQRGVEQRLAMAGNKRPLDWAAAEALAFATLATEGRRVRLSGQDSQRGTFSQRHAVLHDVVDGHAFSPFAFLAKEQAPVEIINSPLCETGVLGFEYGYSLDDPDALVAWEAQFGDFVNAGQVIIDQFIAGAADRWRRLSGLVLLLPHGLEGMGPEHSSARLERFLNLAARDNIQIVYPSTPAQYFHSLRRQVLRRWRKPLIVLTPKSLLRNPRAVSSLDDLAKGPFRRVLPDERPAASGKTSRILLCSGKIYYDLAEFREKQNRDDVAVIRVEQFYPLSDNALQIVLQPYRDGTPAYWVQEEPQNMGARAFWNMRFCDRLLGRFPLRYLSRPESASPATGSKAVHKREQQSLVERAFAERAASD
jgi:2-oxoglutarate dehydrogenase E1 component